MPERKSEELVNVFDTNDDSEAMVVKSLLESAGMEVLISSVEAQPGLFPFSAAPMGHMRLRVPSSQAEDAKRVIAESRHQGPQEVEDENE